MKIVIINGTDVKGCTYHIKENFVDELRNNNEIQEFYLPKDLPHFCCGCKNCFIKSDNLCPHTNYINPIWNAMLNADLLVFTSPVYALRTTAQMKSLLDHLCVHWIVHRPDIRMFNKRAVILTNAIGIFNGGAQRDISISLSWLGISHIRKLGIGLLEGIIWSELSDKRRNIIIKKIKKLAQKYKNKRSARTGLKVHMKFLVSKKMHQSASRTENPLSADNQYWADNGWIKV